MMVVILTVVKVVMVVVKWCDIDGDVGGTDGIGSEVAKIL